MSHNVLPRAVVEELIRELIEADEARCRERSKHQAPPAAGVAAPAGAAQLERYANATIRRIVASVQEAQKGYRHRTLLKEAIALHSLTLSPWVPENIRNGMDPRALLLSAAIANGYVADRGEAEARRTTAAGRTRGGGTRRFYQGREGRDCLSLSHSPRRGRPPNPPRYFRIGNAPPRQPPTWRISPRHQ